MNKLNIKRKDFPLLKNKAGLSYLDNAATAQLSKQTIEAMGEYYAKYHANSHSESYKLGFEAAEKYEEARSVVADFLRADKSEIIFTSGATYGLNALAGSLGQKLKAGDNVVLTRMEHHSNLLPWIKMSKFYGFEIRFIELDANYKLDLASARQVIDTNTRIVSVVHMSNALGTVNPVEEIIALARSVAAVSIIDAAQSVPHMSVDVRKLDCDFLVFSGHKLGGPAGIGVLYGKQEKLKNLEPFLVGGGMVSSATYNGGEWAGVPQRFEAGSVNIAGAVGLSVAIKYLSKIGMKNVLKHEQQLIRYVLAELKKIKQVKIIGPSDTQDRGGVVSFVVSGVHAHDVAAVLDAHGVAVRAGHHCTMPLMKLLGIGGTVRASFWIYNDKKDADKLISGVKKAVKMFQIK